MKPEDIFIFSLAYILFAVCYQAYGILILSVIILSLKIFGHKIGRYLYTDKVI